MTEMKAETALVRLELGGPYPWRKEALCLGSVEIKSGGSREPSEVRDQCQPGVGQRAIKTRDPTADTKSPDTTPTIPPLPTQSCRSKGIESGKVSPSLSVYTEGNYRTAGHACSTSAKLRLCTSVQMSRPKSATQLGGKLRN
ncbi:hypothetical protein SKAU_G00009700 [Synaphobranchus kaupii]|uniref:Uncharacterized protein n=1 Tax=Synaphobranchus kaupii TaxID=118154 RepID=A0A9Q1GBL8_SYNKA|nr:hypothetical protein SKAU_G00009700 [Synaphobranchus kaupii]